MRKLFLSILAVLFFCSTATLPAQETQISPPQVVIARPTITIAGATVDSTASPTGNAREAQIFWKFGTVSGTYTTCTVQAKTTYDGTNYLTLGSAVAVAATTDTGTAWSLYGQLGTTTVTTSASSTTVALGFGLFTKYTFNCSVFGTSAPVTITVIYR